LGRVIVDLERVEGEARIIVEVDGGYNARFLGLDYRAIERVMERQPLYRLPLVASRICGICFISHYIASLKEIYRVKGVELEPEAAATLEYANTIQHLVDNLLHFFVMCSSDVGKLTGRRDVVEKLRVRALKLFSEWMMLVARAFGDPVHPMLGFIGSVPGIDEVAGRVAGDAARLASETLNLVDEGRGLAEEMLREYSGLYPGSSYTYIALRGGGLVSGDPVNPLDGSRVEPGELLSSRRLGGHGYIRAPRHEPPYRTGPLARSLARGSITASELREYSESPLLYHSSRLAELGETCKLLSEGWTPEPFRARPGGVVEAPRGLLLHSYSVAGDARRVEVLTPTAINTEALERDIVAALEEVKPKTEREVAETASIVARAYNPCLSCAACIVRVVWR